MWNLEVNCSQHKHVCVREPEKTGYGELSAYYKYIIDYRIS